MRFPTEGLLRCRVQVSHLQDVEANGHWANFGTIQAKLFSQGLAAPVAHSRIGAPTAPDAVHAARLPHVAISGNRVGNQVDPAHAGECSPPGDEVLAHYQVQVGRAQFELLTLGC